MSLAPTRRRFLQLSALALTGAAPPAARQAPVVRAHTLTVVSGKPRERGRRYGKAFQDGIRAFLDQEIYAAFVKKPSPRDEMLRYAGACARAVHDYSPAIHDELEGMAEGSGVRLEELVLMNLHEELWHKGVLPKVEHCTAVAVGPPQTKDRHTYVGQTWDWMTTVAGVSTMLLWRRPEGPSVLAYAYPGLWVGAGLNSAGLALTWTSAGGKEAPGPRVGIPSYVLIAHLLYQKSLEDVVAEAKRATHAGWFTFVMADGTGRLLNLEGSPRELAVEWHTGQLVRVGYGSRQMTRTAETAKVRYHARCQKLYDLLTAQGGKTDGPALQGTFGDPKQGISVGRGTIDMMVFDTTARQAHVARGPAYLPRWKTFTFQEA
jgi:hypothetical protein